jgi:hypothetical protein
MEMEVGDGKSCALLVRACSFASRRRWLCIWFQLAFVDLGFADAIVASCALQLFCQQRMTRQSHIGPTCTGLSTMTVLKKND